VRDLLEVADRIVGVGLLVAPQRLQIVGVIEHEQVGVTGAGLLARVLATLGGHELVDRVVGVEAVGRDLGVAVRDGVADLDDVADRVVLVAQILQQGAVAGARGVLPDQSEGLGSYAYSQIVPLPCSIRSRWPRAL
jgi:hypothetical protein